VGQAEFRGRLFSSVRWTVLCQMPRRDPTIVFASAASGILRLECALVPARQTYPMDRLRCRSSLCLSSCGLPFDSKPSFSGAQIMVNLLF